MSVLSVSFGRLPWAVISLHWKRKVLQTSWLTTSTDAAGREITAGFHYNYLYVNYLLRCVGLKSPLWFPFILLVFNKLKFSAFGIPWGFHSGVMHSCQTLITAVGMLRGTAGNVMATDPVSLDWIHSWSESSKRQREILPDPEDAVWVVCKPGKAVSHRHKVVITLLLIWLSTSRWNSWTSSYSLNCWNVCPCDHVRLSDGESAGSGPCEVTRPLQSSLSLLIYLVRLALHLDSVPCVASLQLSEW